MTERDWLFVATPKKPRVISEKQSAAMRAYSRDGRVARKQGISVAELRSRRLGKS
jgi:hypothetical protein